MLNSEINLSSSRGPVPIFTVDFPWLQFSYFILRFWTSVGRQKKKREHLISWISLTQVPYTLRVTVSQLFAVCFIVWSSSTLWPVHFHCSKQGLLDWRWRLFLKKSFKYPHAFCTNVSQISEAGSFVFVINDHCRYCFPERTTCRFY